MVLPWRKLQYSLHRRTQQVKEHNSYVTNTVNIHSISKNHPQANISDPKIIDQDRKPVAREAILEATTLPSTITQEKVTSQTSSTTFLEQEDFPVSLTKW